MHHDTGRLSGFVLIVATWLIALVMPQTVAAQSLIASSPPTLSAGDRWTFVAERSVQDGQTVTQAFETRYFIERRAEDGSYLVAGSSNRTGQDIPFTERRTAALNLIESGSYRFDPATDTWRFPLREGKHAFKYRRQLVLPTDATPAAPWQVVEGTVTVTRARRIDTPAGQFDGARLQVVGRVLSEAGTVLGHLETSVYWAAKARFFVAQESREYAADGKTVVTIASWRLKSLAVQP
jgi:hypothetical protein